MRKAVYLDRDGVINRPVYNPQTREFEPPHSEAELELFPWTVSSLKRLLSADYLLFLISNQPDYAKGKASMESIQSVHRRLADIFHSEHIVFSEYYYCYHHPKGIVKEYSFDCECRKPKPFFLLQSFTTYDIDPGVSWMIGDRDTDVLCGQNAGVKTILVREKNSEKIKPASNPDFVAANLREAVDIILNENTLAE